MVKLGFKQASGVGVWELPGRARAPSLRLLPVERTKPWSSLWPGLQSAWSSRVGGPWAAGILSETGGRLC